MDLVHEIYCVTKNFPSDERFGLVSQMRRSAVSTPSNITEGRLRGGEKEFRRFLSIFFGSVGELSTQIEIAKRNIHVSINYQKAEKLLVEVMKILNTLIRKT